MRFPGIVGGRIRYSLLHRICPDPDASNVCTGKAYEGRSKLETLLGPSVFRDIARKSVIDFGCGSGAEAIELALRGRPRRVIGIDIREAALAEARRSAEQAGVSDRCVFVSRTDEAADVIISLDGFEHYGDPAGTLALMRRLVRDDGLVLISFGPTWFHPHGGHLFSVFPWSHLLFTEKALIRWRADFRAGGATRFGEVEGGLNQMTIRRFRRLIERSAFEVAECATVPIRRLRRLHHPLTVEFTTALVRCRLIPRKNG